MTGLTIAGIRAAETERADRLFADQLAGAFVMAAGSPPSRATGRQAAALRLWVVARTVFLDELVMAACADGSRQVVLLGAGFDTRAFRLPWPPGVRCFELDTPDVLDSKEQVLSAQARHQRRALLISAALDPMLLRSRPARRRTRPASAAPRPHLATQPPGAGAPDRPLPALLSQALVTLTIEFDNESEHQIQHRTTRGPAAGSREP